MSNTGRAADQSKAKPDVTLSSGRVVSHYVMNNGAQHAYMADGGRMSEAEWSDYCIRVQLASVEACDRARAERHAASKAAFKNRGPK